MDKCLEEFEKWYASTKAEKYKDSMWWAWEAAWDAAISNKHSDDKSPVRCWSCGSDDYPNHRPNCPTKTSEAEQQKNGRLRAEIDALPLNDPPSERS